MYTNSNESQFSATAYESNRILAKFPDRIPIIIKTSDKNISKLLKKNKFLAPQYISVSTLLFTIRQQINCDSSKALFLFCDNKLISGTEILLRIYENYKIDNKLNNTNSDKFLYLELTFENTFG